MLNKYPLFARIYSMLYRPMDIAGLAVFRIFFGLIILYECWRGTRLLPIVMEYNRQSVYFKFRFFEWVEPISPAGMEWLFIVYAIAGLAIVLGLFYHVATLVAALCISYIFLVDVTNYLNHFYLVIIISFMMIFIPAHKGWSLYALFRKNKARLTVPGWAIWVLRIQIGIVYFYGAIAKMNVDWINGMPLYDWLGDHARAYPSEAFMGSALGVYFFAYAGLLFDLLVVPFLLYRPTRAIAFCFTLSFHLTNFHLFNIGIFPWFMIGATTIFFESSWPRDFLSFFFQRRFRPVWPSPYPPFRLNTWQKAGLILMCSHIAFQGIFPLRHFFYNTNGSWTEEGHNFSWHMKLRGKSSTLDFTLRDPETGKTHYVNPRRLLTKRQARKMSGKPSLIIQFAHHLRDLYTLPGEKPVEVYADGKVALNGRKSQRFVDPEVNLSEVTAKEWGNEWVFPIRQPVWNATHKTNRFGPALKKDDIAMRAIPALSEANKAVADKVKRP
jgi:vitamin K-dependent gamma-carboxylase